MMQMILYRQPIHHKKIKNENKSKNEIESDDQLVLKAEN